MRRLPIGVVLSLLLSFQAMGQNKALLTLGDAIATGLDKNFSIRLAKKDNEIARNNNTYGNAGFLPKLGANGSIRENNLSSETWSDGGSVTKTNNGGTTELALGASLDWTLFDGAKMFIQKDKLDMLQKQGETATRVTIENIVAEIIVAYHSIIQNKNRLKVLQDAIDFSNKRRELTMIKYQIGSASELAYLQSLTDLNADSAAFLRQQVALKNVKAGLNILLANDATNDFEVNDTIVFLELPDYITLISSLAVSNGQIEIANQNSEIARLNYRISHAPKYPQVDLFSTYNFNRKYGSGATGVYKNYGPVVGASLTCPIFDGFSRQRNSANALIQKEANEIQLQQAKRDIEAQVFQLNNNYRNNLKLVKFETENLKIARRNSYIAFERFRLGEMSDIDLRQVQIMQLQAEDRLLLAQFEAKQIEVELLRISGKISSCR